MYLALDAHYGGGSPSGPAARVAGVWFRSLKDGEPAGEEVLEIMEAAPYQPGSFYLRELPGLVALIRSLEFEPGLIFVDGYVWLDERQRPGLGAHLWEAHNRRIPVIGVAKSRFPGAPAVPVYRRTSRRPLYVSSAGIPPAGAAFVVTQMQGSGRLPDLLKQADRLARG